MNAVVSSGTEVKFTSVSSDQAGEGQHAKLWNQLSKLINDNQQSLFEGSSLTEEARRGLMESLQKIIENASKQRVKELKAEVDQLFKSLEKQRKASGLQKFLKVLGVLAIVFTAASAIVNPTPATIIMLTLAVALVLEPAITTAAGGKSVTEQGMQALVKSLTEQFGVAEGAVFAALIFLVVSVGLCYGAPRAIAWFAASRANTAATTVSNLQKFKDFLFTAPSPENQKKITAALNAAEASVTLATGALQFELAHALLQRDKHIRNTAQHKADADFTQTSLDDLNNLLRSIREVYVSGRSASDRWFLPQQ